MTVCMAEAGADTQMQAVMRQALLAFEILKATTLQSLVHFTSHAAHTIHIAGMRQHQEPQAYLQGAIKLSVTNSACKLASSICPALLVAKQLCTVACHLRQVLACSRSVP